MMESFANYNKEKQKLFPDKETQNISYKTKEIKDIQKSATIKPLNIEHSFTNLLDKDERQRHRQTEVNLRIPSAALETQAKNPSQEEEQKLWEMFK